MASKAGCPPQVGDLRLDAEVDVSHRTTQPSVQKK